MIPSVVAPKKAKTVSSTGKIMASVLFCVFLFFVFLCFFVFFFFFFFFVYVESILMAD